IISLRRRRREARGFDGYVPGVSSSAPILFRLALHGRCRRVLELEPVLRSTATIARTEALADDALEAEFAGVAEHHVAGLLDMLVDFHPVCERTLPSPLDSLEVNISTLPCCHRLQARCLPRRPEP